ncbi:AAA family ATPase [Virgibacillus halodenitrificans]|uniref:AAA family ATPase n=1 Tax=Virgibacillus halodenitrificans TaxID=1482 RepID=UPI0009E7A9D7
MYVSDLYISNFRSIKNIHIPLGKGKNVIVGKNNSGKTNIIKALNLILGEKTPTANSFEERDFHVSKTESESNTRDLEEIFIAAKLAGSDFNQDELKKVKYIREHMFGQGDWLKINENYEFELNDFFKKDIDQFESKEFDTYKESDIKNWGKEINEIVLYVYVKKDDANIEVINGLAVNKNNYEKYLRCYPVTNSLRDALITSAVVPAFREPDNELKLNKWNWYGKLMNKVWMNKSEESNSEIEDMNTRLSILSNRVFQNTSNELEDILQSLFSFEEVSFRILPKDSKELYKNIQLYINDGIESLLSDKGTGIQSVTVITLFKYYCKHFHNNHSLLAIEEPELYLHPHSRRMLSNELDEFVTSGNNQVVVTSHSPDFLRNTEIENIIVVRKSLHNNSTQAFKLDDNEDRVQEIQKIKQFLWGRNSEIFFAEKVILVEGGEEYIIPIIADTLYNQKGILDIENISVINVGGKSQFKSYIKLFNDLSIDYRVIADFDFLETGIEQLSEFSPHFNSHQLSDIRSIISDYSEGFEKNKKISNKLLNANQQDAKALCYLLDEMCEKEEFLEELKSLWSYLRPKVSKKINYHDLMDNDKAIEMVKEFLYNLRKDNIVILKGGELEDFYREQAFKIFEESAVRGKELRVLKLAELIREGKYDLSNVIDITEYVEAIYDFTARSPSCKLISSCKLTFE